AHLFPPHRAGKTDVFFQRPHIQTTSRDDMRRFIPRAGPMIRPSVIRILTLLALATATSSPLLPIHGAVAQATPDAPSSAPPPAAATASPPSAASDGDMQITWQVRNRFRLFREERDFTLHTEAMRTGSILAAEEALALQSDGRGW